jgi:hypothetical protein|tara:strand:+ start:341 stop:1297 length:957 start_codon:yes stop_codon:yes gene_type:complete
MIFRVLKTDLLSGFFIFIFSAVWFLFFIWIESSIGLGPGEAHIDETTYLNSNITGYYIGNYFYKVVSLVYYEIIYVLLYNFVLYTFVNIMVFFLLKKFVFRDLFVFIIFLFFLIDPYRTHLATHVLKDTTIIFLVFLMVCFNTRASILGLFCAILFRLASPLYFLARFKFGKIFILLAIFFLFLVIYIFPEFFTYLLLGGNEDMQFRVYDEVPTFNSYGLLGDFARAAIWPILTISGTFFLISPAPLFFPIFFTVIISQLLCYRITKKCAFSFGVYAAMGGFALLTPGFTTYVRYVYPLLCVLPIIVILNYGKKLYAK